MALNHFLFFSVVLVSKETHNVFDSKKENLRLENMYNIFEYFCSISNYMRIQSIETIMLYIAFVLSIIQNLSYILILKRIFQKT